MIYCVLCDFLLRYVVINDFVKENVDCFDSVIGVLEWCDWLIDCYILWLYFFRKVLTINVIVIVDFFGEF